MKVLWLCNLAPGVVEQKRSGRPGSGLWMDRMLQQLREKGVQMRILCPGTRKEDGTVDGSCSYHCFRSVPPQEYAPELEYEFSHELEAFCPDVIHIWGTEYGHTLAMVRAAEAEGRIGRVVISLQGICSAITGHYAEGIPFRVQKQYTFRDFVRQDNILQQKRKFALRGAHEAEALRLAGHVMGRTDWDQACARSLHPGIRYHRCGETLRPDFYEGLWDYESCRRHRIFASSCTYPVKGFHYLLEALAQLAQEYPDVILAVPGKSFLNLRGRDALRQSSYQKYLAGLVKKYGLENRIEFLGSLSADQMKEQYLLANVFALPSTVENSPNSLGEAMLLGVPSVAAHVGGVANLLKDGEEGFLYQSTAPYMLAYYISRMFDMEAGAASLGAAAAAHALKTHDPEKNFRDLLEIYREITT